MSFNFINAEEFSINSLLLMDRWILRYFVGLGSSGVGHYGSAEYRAHLGVVLAHHPAIRWYFENDCPESAPRVAELVRNAPPAASAEDVRGSEVFVMNAMDSFMVYVWPEVMEANCPYIRDWQPERLLSMTDFTGKTVLDIGSGTGRLAFAAATLAKKVYAAEPVDRLREHMRGKIAQLGIRNVVVSDGTVEAIPYEDDTFDIVMSSCVIGDNYDAEYAEMARVVKSGGCILDCDGEEDRRQPLPDAEMLRLGFDYTHYATVNGGDAYRYLKRIFK